MNTYCVKCRKNTENINRKIVRTKNDKSRFVKEREGKGLLSNLRIKTLLSKIRLLYALF